MENVAFRLLRYWFEEADLHLGNTHVDEKINIDFLPSGVYHKEKGLFELSFVFVAWAANNTPDNYTVKVKCKAEFQFKEILDIKDIPPFFYPNSIAILFPYVRAFVSTLTLQANVQPMLLPTINLSPLQEKLRNNTVVK